MVTKGETWVRGKSAAWDEYTHKTICKIVNNKDLLYSTGNSQYSVITYHGKESIKVCTDTHTHTDTHIAELAVHQKPTQNCKSSQILTILNSCASLAQSFQ